MNWQEVNIILSWRRDSYLSSCAQVREEEIRGVVLPEHSPCLRRPGVQGVQDDRARSEAREEDFQARGRDAEEEESVRGRVVITGDGFSKFLVKGTHFMRLLILLPCLVPHLFTHMIFQQEMRWPFDILFLVFFTLLSSNLSFHICGLSVDNVEPIRDKKTKSPRLVGTEF